jgi:hypothetical protein
MTEFIKNRLYTNPRTGLVIRCTKTGISNDGVSGIVVDSGTEKKYNKGHRSTRWNECVFVPCEIYQEPELNVIL